MKDSTVDEGPRLQPDPIEIPGAVVECFFTPTRREEVGEIVVDAAREGDGLLIVGGRTRLQQANPARGIRFGLSLRGLSGIDEFEPEEGVLHVAAGTPIREVRDVVRAEGWELPLDPPGASSTVGGTIASAAVGPRAQAFGRVSDAILGLDLVAGDGVASKCGGRVVKNVTGYDLAKLYCGSFGSIGIVTGAWLRLRPKPALRRVFVARPDPGPGEFERHRRLADRTSVAALVWREDPGSGSREVTIELAGSEEGVCHDRDWIADRIALVEVGSDAMDRIRDERIEGEPDALALRVRVLGTECGAMVRRLLDSGLAVSVDPGLGTIHARGRLEDPKTLLAIRQDAHAGGGLATFERLPAAWRDELDVFDRGSAHAALHASLKARFDPQNVLNPGRFEPGGRSDGS